MNDVSLPGFAEPFPLEAPKPNTSVPWLDAFTAGFALENDVLNAWDFLSKPNFVPEEGYDNVSALRSAGLWDDRNAFIGVQSQAELAYRKGKLDRERALRQDYMASGTSGFLGALAGGVFSPTMFIPLVGAGKRGLAAFKSAAMYGTAAGVIQEIPLQMNQTERGWDESAESVIGQAILSGILGRLAAGASPKVMRRAAESMATPPGTKAISTLGSEVDLRTRVPDEPPVPKDHVRLYQAEGDGTRFTTDRRLHTGREFYVDTPASTVGSRTTVDLPPEVALGRKEVPDGGDAPNSSVGAAAVDRRTEGVKESWATRYTGVGRAASLISPVVRVIEQAGVAAEDKFYQARWMMQQLSGGGVRQADNVEGRSVADGGYVEHLKTQHYGKLWKAQSQVDLTYQKYAFEEEKVPLVGANFRANRKAKGKSKLGRQEFNIEVSREMRDPGTSTIPEVREAAEIYNRELYEPLYKDALDAGIYDEVKDIIGDVGYLNRIFIPEKVKARMPELVQKLAAHYAQLLEQDWYKHAQRFQRQFADEEEIKKFSAMELDEVAKARQDFLNKLKDEELKRSPKVVAMEDQLTSVKERIRDLKKQKRETPLTLDERAKDVKHPLDGQIEQLTKEVKTLEEVMPAESREFRAMASGIRRSLRNLNKSIAMRANRSAAKLATLDRIEDLNFNTLDRMTRAVDKVMVSLDGVSDEVLDDQLTGLTEQLNRAGKLFDKGEDRLDQLSAGEDYGQAIKQELLQADRAERLIDVASRIEQAEAFDRAGTRAVLEELRANLIRKSQNIVERRGARAEKLRQDAKALAPEASRERLAAELGANRARRDKFLDRWRERGLANPSAAIDGVAPDFRDWAVEQAQAVAESMANMTDRLPVHDIIVGKHGVERARVLSIPSKELEFVLENDAERLARIYIRTLAPDVEVAKRFGDVNASSILGSEGSLVNEYRQLLDKIETEVDRAGKPLSEAVKEQRRLKLAKRYKDIRNDLQGTLDRIRHLWGIPENPEGFAYRAGRLVMQLNVMRYMGMVMVSSVADVANIVLKHGLTRSMRDVFVPLITNFKQLQMTGREAYLAGEALDVYLHTRASQLFDINDMIRPGTKLERGVEYATSRMGLIAGFDLWNRELKKLSSVATTAHMMDDMKLLIEGGGAAKDRAAAQEYIASLGLRPEDVDRIWKQMLDTNGGEKVNGLWWPNTENWTDKEAQRLFRQALSGEISSTIVTPGLERPLWMDRNIGFRLIGQFRSFAFSSLTKTLMAGLQQPDMALMNGTIISLAMGALSYYLWALTTGGDALDEALNGDIGKWADEAIARSGRLAVAQEGWELAQRLPWIRDVSTFSGQRNTQRQGVDFTELFMGPSYDFLSKAGYVLVNLDSPTGSTVHAARQLVPLQNVFTLRRGFDALERLVVDTFDIPERRGQ